MKIAVTGATGFLGMNLVDRLVQEGHQVVAIDRHGFDRLPPDLVTARASILDTTAIQSALDGVEVVYHLASVITLAQHDELAWRVNTEGVRVVARAARAVGARRMVHCSSLHAFDHHHNREVIDENSPRSTAADLPLYDRSKWAGEQEFQRVIEDGLDGVVVNPTGIVGPVDREPLSRLNRPLLMAARGYLLVGVGGGFDLVDVRDVASGLCAAAERGRTGENYLLPGHYTLFADALRLAANYNGHRGPIWCMPLSALSVTAPLMDTVGRCIRRDLLGKATIDTLLTSPQVDGTKARRELGHQPRPITETIQDLVTFFQQSGRLRSRRRRTPGTLSRTPWLVGG